MDTLNAFRSNDAVAALNGFGFVIDKRSTNMDVNKVTHSSINKDNRIDSNRTTDVDSTAAATKSSGQQQVDLFVSSSKPTVTTFHSSTQQRCYGATTNTPPTKKWKREGTSFLLSSFLRRRPLCLQVIVSLLLLTALVQQQQQSNGVTGATESAAASKRQPPQVSSMISSRNRAKATFRRNNSIATVSNVPRTFSAYSKATKTRDATKATPTSTTIAAIRGGGGGRSTRLVSMPKSYTQQQQQLNIIYIVTFLIFCSMSITALIPVQVLLSTATSGNTSIKEVTKILSSITVVAAVVEILCSYKFGLFLDTALYGYKYPLMLLLAAPTIVYTITFLFYSVSPIFIGICKFSTIVSTALIALTLQTYISHIVFSTKPEQQKVSTTVPISKAMGIQMATISLGFLIGITCAGYISSNNSSTAKTSSTIYCIASVLNIVSILFIQFGLQNTSKASVPRRRRKRDVLTRIIPKRKNVVAAIHDSNNSCGGGGGKTTSIVSALVTPFSNSMRLLTNHGTYVRVLGILLCISVLPMYMGDIFQLFVKAQWDLSTKDFSMYLGLIGVLGIISNIVSGRLISKYGIKSITSIAILSRIVQNLGIVFCSYTGTLITTMIGFLASSQTIGVIAALMQYGGDETTSTQSGAKHKNDIAVDGIGRRRRTSNNRTTSSGSISHGELAGERAALLALLKVIGPIVYSILFIKGQEYLNTNTVPFVFNIMLCCVSLVLVQLYL